MSASASPSARDANDASRRKPLDAPALRRMPPWLLGIALAVVAMGARAALAPWLGDSLPFLFAYPAAAFAAYFGGPIAALAVVVVSIGWTWTPPLALVDNARTRLLHSVAFVSAGMLAVFGAELVRQVTEATRPPRAEGVAPATHKPTGWHVLTLVLAALLPIAFIVMIGWRAYVDAFARAEESVQRIARIAEEHAARVFDTNAVLADTLINTIARAPDATIREPGTGSRLREIIAGVPQITGIALWDRDGAMLAGGADLGPAGEPSIGSQPYFRALRADPGTPVVTPLRVLPGATGPRFIYARARVDAHGAFDGAVTIALDPDQFTGFYAALAGEAPGLGVTLLRTDGRVLARWPAPRAEFREGLPRDSALMRAIAGGKPTGVLQWRPMPEETTRLVAFCRVTDHPVYVTAGLARDDILAAWFSQAMTLAGVGFPAVLLLVLAAWAALRRSQQQQATLHALQSETQRRARAESALHETQHLEALGRLTGTVAHDFNNLLMVVSNNLHVLSRRIPGAADSAQVAAIARAVRNGEQLTRQLLSVAPRKALRPEVLLLQERLPALGDLLRSTVGARVQVTIAVDADTAAIEVDPTELELALLNLAINAHDAMPDGGQLVVRARNASAGDTMLHEPGVELCVSDTGRGIPADVIGKVFEPLFTTKPKGKGTGLGLSQVHGLATQAGGHARVSSVEGRGTMVRLEFPRASAPVAERASSTRPARNLAGHVLLVEDDADVAAATIPLLGALGLTVRHASDVQAAIECIDREPRLCAVVSDVVMPGSRSGVDLALWMREHRPGLPVVLMTGYASELQLAAAQGFVVLQKPVSPDTLARVLGDAGLATEAIA